jgi:hypothetical protein
MARFQETTSISTDDRLKSLAFYNLGTLMWAEAYPGSSLSMLLTQADIRQQAITNLAEAIRLDPDNEDAKYNLEYLEKIQAKEGQPEASVGMGFGAGTIKEGF